MLPHEWWLIGGVVALYVYDAVMLLYNNELVLFEQGDGRWTFSVGSDFELAGRHLFVPALFAPHRPILRLCWSSRFEQAGVCRIRGLRAWRIGMKRTALYVALIGVAFAALPLVLSAGGSAAVLLAWILAVYVTILLALAHTWRHRRLTALSKKDFASLASDALLCAPYALNLSRKLGMRAFPTHDFVPVIRALLDAEKRAHLVDIIRGKLQRQIEMEDCGSERHAQILNYLHHIEDALA